jgi:hypothetical protein
MQAVFKNADVLQVVAAGLSREQAGRLLAPLCRAGLHVVRAADAREDAGLKPGWRWGAWPLYEVQRTRARVWAVYGSDEGLARVLERLVMALHELHFTTSPDHPAFAYVFDRKLACDGVQPSVLGVHRLRVFDNTEFVSCMKSWARIYGYADWAKATMHRYGRDRGPRTQVVLRLLKVLGLVPARGRGLKAPPDNSVHAVHAQHKDPLWHSEFVAMSVSKRGWIARDA